MWQPLDEGDLWDMINNAEWVLEPPTCSFWNQIKISPQKWQQSPQGDEGGGFWVVAVIGQKCIYYNDIEEGFNISSFDEWGQIKEYSCNQNDLQDFLDSYHKHFLRLITSAP